MYIIPHNHQVGLHCVGTVMGKSRINNNHFILFGALIWEGSYLYVPSWSLNYHCLCVYVHLIGVVFQIKYGVHLDLLIYHRGWPNDWNFTEYLIFGIQKLPTDGCISPMGICDGKSVPTWIELTSSAPSHLHNIQQFHGGKLCSLSYYIFSEGYFLSILFISIRRRVDTGNGPLNIIKYCCLLLIFIWYLFHHGRDHTH